MLETLILGSYKPYRRGIIPPEIIQEISFFHSELMTLEDDREHISIVIQVAGHLARLGQYGYVDQVNEQYIQYSPNSSPHAIPYSEVRQSIEIWIRMIKQDFFDKAIEDKDVEEAQKAIEEMEDVSMWAKLTDQYDTEELTTLTLDYLEVMYETVSKLKQQQL